MKNVFIKIIKIYQILFSPEKSIFVKIGIKKYRHTCIFYPTCSSYGIEAIEKYGVFKGFKMLFIRVLRCRPGVKAKIDKV